MMNMVVAPPSPPHSFLPETQIARDLDNEWLLRNGLSQPAINAILAPNTIPDFTVISPTSARSYLRRLVQESRASANSEQLTMAEQTALITQMQNHINDKLDKMYNPQRVWDTHDILPEAEKGSWISFCAQWNADNYDGLMDQVQRLASLLDKTQQIPKQQSTPRRRQPTKRGARSRTRSAERSRDLPDQGSCRRRSDRIAAKRDQAPRRSARITKRRSNSS